jgi:hypothetical protein
LCCLGERRLARKYHLAVRQHGASAALSQTATETRRDKRAKLMVTILSGSHGAAGLTEPRRFLAAAVSQNSVASNAVSALFSALTERSSCRTEARPAQHAQAELDPSWRIVRTRCHL